MTYHNLIRAVLIVIPFSFSPIAVAQSPLPPVTIGQVARPLGFVDTEIRRIESGDVISKSLSEGSDKELAGVVAVFVNKPIAELADAVLQGKMVASDTDIRAFRAWKPTDSPDGAFADAGLSPDETGEARAFTKASPGAKLNLSSSEIAQFKNVSPTPDAVNVPLRAMLKARYIAYLHGGLQGIAPYTRGHGESSPATELAQAIRETMPATPRKDFLQALLEYPADQPASVQHRFYWYKQIVEDRPTFILAHVAERQSDTSAIMTEEQFYVGHSYNSNFIAAGGIAVRGGTLVFYVNRTFTDQVAGFGSGLKHNIGRGQMLDDVTDKLKRLRDAQAK
jgi:hypothetical protein